MRSMSGLIAHELDSKIKTEGGSSLKIPDLQCPIGSAFKTDSLPPAVPDKLHAIELDQLL